jgi:hypothetical protein
VYVHIPIYVSFLPIPILSISHIYRLAVYEMLHMASLKEECNRRLEKTTYKEAMTCFSPQILFG